MAASWRHPDMKWRLLDEDVLRALRKMLQVWRNPFRKHTSSVTPRLRQTHFLLA